MSAARLPGGGADAGPPAFRLAPDVRRAADGDPDAFERLVDATRSTVTSIALAILEDVDRSHDVAQEVYLHAWRDLSKLRDPTSFLPWLRQVCRHRARQALRSRIRRRKRVTRPNEDMFLEAAADPSPDALERLLSEEERELLADAIGELPAGSREAVVLYYREGRSSAQVAELLDLSEAAVRKRLSRARRQLHERLAPLLEKSAPDERFTAGILAALPLAASGTGAGAGLTLGQAAGAGRAAAKVEGAATVAGLGAGIAGVLAGVAAAWTGVLVEARTMWKGARSEEERRTSLRYGIAAAAAVGTLGTAMLLRPAIGTAVVVFPLLVGFFVWAHGVWLPRVRRRQDEAELRDDPSGAAARHRDRRRRAWRGIALGALFGATAIAAAWLVSG